MSQAILGRVQVSTETRSQKGHTGVFLISGPAVGHSRTQSGAVTRSWSQGRGWIAFRFRSQSRSSSWRLSGSGAGFYCWARNRSRSRARSLVGGAFDCFRTG